MTTPVFTAPHYRRLKIVTFTLGGTDFSCQLTNWSILNNTVDGTKTWSYCGNSSEFRTETDDDWALQVTFFSDWRSGGISEYLYVNTRAVAAFQLDHHPDIIGEHVRWTGSVVLKSPTVGGDLRAIESTSATLLILGFPTYARIG